MLFDKLDLKILGELQRDARISNHKLAQRVGLSPSPCWRRVKRLEEQGVIQRYVTLLNPGDLNLAVIAYAHVLLENHHPDTVQEFDEVVQRRPEVLECYSMSGQHDYLLKVVSSSMEAYEEFLSAHLLQIPAVRTANTSFVLKQKKFTTALPLGNL